MQEDLITSSSSQPRDSMAEQENGSSVAREEALGWSQQRPRPLGRCGHTPLPKVCLQVTEQPFPSRAPPEEGPRSSVTHPKVPSALV